jgi:chromosomal replication initiator protein
MYQGGSENSSPEKEKAKKEGIAGGAPSEKVEFSDDLSRKLNDVWLNCMESIKCDIDGQVFSAYFKRLKFTGYDQKSNAILLSAPSKLISRYIKDNYASRVTNFLASHSAIENISLNISVNTDSKSVSYTESPAREGQVKEGLPASASPSYVVVKKIVAPAIVKSVNPSEQVQFGQQPNPKYTFENFVVGNSNQFCHAASLQVADKPGESYNPLFIYGGVGLGKTHLMHAIGNSVLARNPNTRVLYLSSETFTNVLIQSLRQGKMDEFKNKLRNIEVLLIDDIQFMRGKETTQEEFFHTFNALYSSKHQIVITSDKNPAEISGIEERLSTRFAWGLIADLQAPDFETRVAILKEKAAREGFNLPEDCAAYIAENFASNVRELEGALTRLHAVSSLQNVPINIELANSALKSLLQPKNVNISVDQIKKVVSNHFGIKVSDMVSKRRNKNLAYPRHIAMYLCRKHTTYSYPEIGQCFGGRDHSSVIHAASSITNKLQNGVDSKGHDLKETMDSLEKSLIYTD